LDHGDGKEVVVTGKGFFSEVLASRRANAGQLLRHAGHSHGIAEKCAATVI
jgi:hypothetical protein